MRRSLAHAEDCRVHERCGLSLGRRLGRRLANGLRSMWHRRLVAILLGRLSQRLLGVVRGILSVRLRIRARGDRLLRRGRGRGHGRVDRSASGRRRRVVDFDVGDRVAFNIVRVEAVAARREVHCAQSAKTRLRAFPCVTYRPAGSAWHSAG
jgi:hypothetical protein